MSNSILLQYDFTSSSFLNGVLTDLGNNNYNAKLVNNPSLNQSGPLSSLKSVVLNAGQSQYISAPSFTTSGSGISISFWFRSNNNSTWARIFDFGNGSGNNNIIAYINSGNLGLSVYKGSSSTQYNNVIPSVNDNKWRHILWTLDPSGVWNLYLNGNLFNIYSKVNYPNSISRTYQYIGKSNWKDPYYSGAIADFRIFNSVLSASNVTNIYNASTSNVWKYTPSIGNFIKLNGGNNVTTWSNLNISSNSNMSISFTINIANVNSNWRNIFHVTSTNNNCCNIGDRVPAIWITAGGQSLHIAHSITNNGNATFNSNAIPLNTNTKVDIVWKDQNVKIYFNGLLNSQYNYPAPLVQTNGSASIYSADPWHSVGGFMIQDLTFYNGSSIQLSTTKVYNYTGCYKDTGNRAIPTYVGNVNNQQECQDYAISNNASLYGLQYYGQCFIGNDINKAIQYGGTTGCPDMGSSWTNQIYSTVPVPKPTYNYVGCYNDTGDRAIPDQMAIVGSVYDCEQLAKQKGYSVYGLQYNGYCFGSNDINSAREYGLQNDQTKCTTLGGAWTNQVYTNIENVAPLTNITPNMPESTDSYNYKVCYNNKDNTAIPTFRGDVTSIDDCAQFAANNQEYIFGVTNNGKCYTGLNVEQALGQGQNNATAYCGTLGSSNSYQVYIRDATTNPLPPVVAKLSNSNFSTKNSGNESTSSEMFKNFDNFSNFNENNNDKYLHSLKIVIIILVIILLIYMMYHVI